MGCNASARSVGILVRSRRGGSQHICPECRDREKTHPAYAAADAAEVAAVRDGQMNFPGVGCPPELYLPRPCAEAQSNPSDKGEKTPCK